MSRKITAGDKNYDIVGGPDFIATLAGLAGAKLPEKDREGQPVIFDSYDISPILLGSGPDPDIHFKFDEKRRCMHSMRRLVIVVVCSLSLAGGSAGRL